MRFSVVIPTRNRPGTLAATLKTCLNQHAFEDYEIIISDNSDNGDSLTVIKELLTKKVQYHRTPKPLAMHDNWEFALQKATGEYICYLGDDDGLHPDALARTNQLFNYGSFQALGSHRVNYFWPNVVQPSQRDLISIPLGAGLEYLEFLPATVANAVIPPEQYSYCLPMIYRGFISRKLCDQAIKKFGRVFQHLIPDIYSGFLFGWLAKKYAVSLDPLFIEGVSSASNGLATSMIAENPSQTQVVDFYRLATESEIQNFSEDHPAPKSLNHCVYDVYRTAMNRFGLGEDFQIDMCAYLNGFFKNHQITNLQHRRVIYERMIQLYRDDDRLISFIQTECRDNMLPSGNELPAERPSGIRGDMLHFGGKSMNVSDVADLGILLGKILPIQHDGTYSRLPPSRYLNESPLEMSLKAEISKRDQEIVNLHALLRETNLSKTPQRVIKKICRLLGITRKPAQNEE
ncbi:MAG: glycosyltransferase family 2 protein [Zavarzinella sp.]